MVSWYIDEGLQRFKREWLEEHPGATVYSIGDQSHATDPDKSQHAPDRGGSKPGDDKGEVDALDVMPGKGVTDDDLDDAFDNLRKSKDKRILYLIRRDKIVSSVTQPWVVRKYNGKYHGHLHISVNDNYDNDQSDWKWETLVARTIPYVAIPGAKLPLLQLGDEDDNQGGWNHVARAQVLANWLDNKIADLDPDGVYGAKTAAKFARIFGGNGRKLELAHIKKLHGIS